MKPVFWRGHQKCCKFQLAEKNRPASALHRETVENGNQDKPEKPDA
ncbi:hypothetical protein [uncultured Dysosmobacter sp.]|nr:hypothetical protein [uncultured Dysosmobacter sp.]